LVIYMIIAWRILYLMPRGAGWPRSGLGVAFTAEEWRAAWLMAKRRQPPILSEMIRLVAGFGGHLGRKGDGHHDPKALWQGLMKLMTYVEALQTVHEIYGTLNYLWVLECPIILY